MKERRVHLLASTQSCFSKNSLNIQHQSTSYISHHCSGYVWKNVASPPLGCGMQRLWNQSTSLPPSSLVFCCLILNPFQVPCSTYLRATALPILLQLVCVCCCYFLKKTKYQYCCTRRWQKFQTRKPIGELGCCESRMAKRIHWWTARWLELCFLESLWLQWSPGRSPHPQLLDVVWCSAAVVVVCNVVEL